MINKFIAVVLFGAFMASTAVADVQTSGYNLVDQEEEVTCPEGQYPDEKGKCVNEEE